MQINGEWLFCDDGVVRPIVRGEAQAADGFWEPVLFLLDIGADRTVFDASTLDALELDVVRSPNEHIGGLGGTVASVFVQTTIRLTDDQGGKVTFRGRFAAVTDPNALDMSVLGRDVTRLFADIADQPGNLVCLLSQRHRYRIEVV